VVKWGKSGNKKTAGKQKGEEGNFAQFLGGAEQVKSCISLKNKLH